MRRALADFYDFAERLQFSEGVGLTREILEHVKRHIPAATEIVRAGRTDDRHGTDYWVKRKFDLPPVSIDLKSREFCPIQKFGSDDACVETTSVYRGLSAKPYRDDLREKPGWTVDERKRTDLIVYTWPHDADLFGAPRMRYWILYFPHLCAAATEHWRRWALTYQERPAQNKGYVTLSVYPPRSVIANSIREFTSGTLTESLF